MTDGTCTRPPSEPLTFQLVVVGGGLAGLCAAIAAARNGTRTAIVHERPVFGGNSSSEIRVVPSGSAGHAAWAAETGIIHEMLLKDRTTNQQTFFDQGLINTHYDLVLMETAAREENLTVFMNTSVRSVTTEETPAGGDYTRRIVSVAGSQLGSERELVFVADQFIDATGDGTVGALAGADFRYGREARGEFDEPLAPLTADDSTLGSTINMRARKVDRPVPYVAPPWVASYTSPDDFSQDRMLYHVELDDFGGYWWLEVNDPWHQIDDNQEIRDELHRHVLGVWNYIKNHSPEKHRFENFVLDWMGMLPGKRESRRLVGDVIVTENDLHVDPRWPDSIAYASWHIDLHMKGAINNRDDPAERENVDTHYSDWVRIVPTSLPLRAYYSRNTENLWMAGRDLSVTHVGLGPVRVMLSLAAQGHAVGIAASFALEVGTTPRAVAAPDGPHLSPLRQRMIEQDVRILGLASEDPTDVAPLATVTASSSEPLVLPETASYAAREVNWLRLDVERAQVVPLTTDRLDRLALHLRNESDSTRSVPVRLERMDRIWDQQAGPVVATAVAHVAGRAEAWVDVVLDAAIEVPSAYRIVLGDSPDVLWANAAAENRRDQSRAGGFRSGPIGTVAQYLTTSPGGPEAKNAHMPSFSPDEIDLPAFTLWRQFRKGVHCVRLTPEQRPYEADQVVNGTAWVEGMPNLWISEPVSPDRPQWVRLDWTEPQTIDRIHVSFDTDLDLETNQRVAFHRPGRCASSWRLLALEGSEWIEIHSEQHNVQRKRVISLDRPITTSAIKLDVVETNGGEGVGVYEIRVQRHH